MLQLHLRRASRPTLPCLILLTAGWFGACASPRTETGAQPAGTVLTDANIASIASTANTGEIQTANLALAETSNPAVRRFAQQMLSDHTEANRRLAAVVGNLDIQPAPTPTTRQLETNTGRAMESLQARSGTDFDRMYIANQIEQHRWLLQTLDGALIPSARHRRMEDYLRWLRATVASHLSQAQQVQQSLGGG
ncbi:MAG TPA: DUF4142 domain-containing protein [Longimicrobiales bacterium]